MRLRFFVPFFCLASVFHLSGEPKEAYVIYNFRGERVLYNKMIEGIAECEILFFGEIHNNPISHWLELEVTKDIFRLKKNIILGAEFFETDNQLILSEYLSGIIDESRFESSMRLWPNYSTDYKPLVQFASDNRIRFIATNIPRRYASYVNHRGLEALGNLSADAKKYIPPLPVLFNGELPCYKNISDGPMGYKLKSMINTDGKLYLAEAQAVKDATMAYNIFKNYCKDDLFIHYNGSYHSDNHASIIWYLKKYADNPVIKTLTTVVQDDVGTLEEENIGKADYIITVDKNMTSTY